MSLATETGNQDFVIDLDKVETTIIGDKGSDLLGVLQELNTDTLTDGRVGLLGLDTTKNARLSISYKIEKEDKCKGVAWERKRILVIWISHYFLLYSIFGSSCNSDVPMF